MRFDSFPQTPLNGANALETPADFFRARNLPGRIEFGRCRPRFPIHRLSPIIYKGIRSERFENIARGAPMNDRGRFIRILGVAGLLATAAGLLLAMGIAAGALVFKSYESASLRAGNKAWDSAAAHANRNPPP